MTALSDDALVGLADRLDELEARSVVLWDALTRCRMLAKQGLLPTHDREKGLHDIWDLIDQTTAQLTAVTQAIFRTGRIVTEEDQTALQNEQTYGFYGLGAREQLRVIAARKRLSARTPKTLRDHGAALLTLAVVRSRITDELDPPEADDTSPTPNDHA